MFFTQLFKSNLIKFNPKVIYYTSTNSTNEDVWELFSEYENNLIVITDNQKNGKGRNNNKWYSKPGHSITCSFILPEIFSKEQFNFHSLIIPIAIINGVKNFCSIDIQVKWPNDLVYKNKKIGGILIESKKKKKYYFNIGLGINVNENKSDFPEALQSKAISLKEIQGYPIQREPLLACIINELNILINNLDISFLIQQWTKFCCHINSEVSFTYNAKKVTGIFKYINEQGQAVISLDNEYINFNGAIKIL